MSTRCFCDICGEEILPRDPIEMEIEEVVVDRDQQPVVTKVIPVSLHPHGSLKLTVQCTAFKGPQAYFFPEVCLDCLPHYLDYLNYADTLEASTVEAKIKLYVQREIDRRSIEGE